VSVRGELVGTATLYQLLFGKNPSRLNAQESALDAALIQAPAASPALSAQRACGLLRTQGCAMPCDTLAAYTRQLLATLSTAPLDRETQLARHLARARTCASTGVSASRAATP
jgi:penicillin-binding protein 1C